jgi:hypothetical protein
MNNNCDPRALAQLSSRGKSFHPVNRIPLYYTRSIEELLFECDLDYDLLAEVIDIEIRPETVLCIVSCAQQPSLKQLNSLIAELKQNVGQKCRIAVFRKKDIKILISR